MNPTVAKGVSIKNIDISNLTYNEAKDKLEEAFNVVLDVNIELKYEDYLDVVRASDINLAYNINNALEEAYNIGRNGNIVECNYSLIATAFLKKNIDFEFTYDEDEIDKIVDQVSTEIPGIVKQYSYYIEEDNLIINPGTDGIKVKTEELKNLILEEIQNRNPLKLVKSFKNTQIEIPYEEVKADKIDIDQIYSEVYSEPQDAYYTEETEDTKFAIYADVDGIDFAISIDEAKQIVLEEGKTEYIIPLNKTKANITINDIGIEAFPYEISEFPTNYDASNLSRSENLRIAASKINGTVIMPGEQFSFNEVVGERTVAEGYQNAKIYSDGQVVDGLAGGICQISSTLYNAALLANLQIDERYNHTFTTSYVKAGRDATVVYGVKDLKFTNNREYPIKIEVSVSNGVVLFKIYGIQEENEYDVKIIPETIDVTPFTVQTITDYSLTPGTSVIKQNGSSGCKVITYKEVWLNGSMISREVLSNDTYKVLNKIVAVGPTQTSSEE
jgi:vancomycin resistance protein YoaR